MNKSILKKMTKKQANLEERMGGGGAIQGERDDQF